MEVQELRNLLGAAERGNDFMAGKDIFISQCMIVKNEEKNIEKALSWGKDIVSEQIVVDTGSVDHTVEIAEKMGARVFSFPWKDDFAAAKNYAIEQAQGEWIAFLDADEYMTPEDAAGLWNVLKGLEPEKYDGIFTGWQQLDEEGRIFSSGTQIRFFRRKPDIRYRRRIHEQLVSTAGRELYIGDVVADFSVFHMGYQGKAYEEKKRSGRNRKLIQAELQEHPEDAEMLGYMGDECFADGDRQEAENWYRRALTCMSPEVAENDQRSAVTCTRLLTLLTEKEEADQDEIEALYDTAVARMPWEADFDYILGRFHAASGRADQAVDSLEEALKKLEKYGCSNKALLLAGNLPDAYELLVRCCYETGNAEKCVAYAATCLQYNKYAMTALSRLLMILAPDMVWRTGTEADKERILEFLKGIYDMSVLKDRLFLIMTAEKSGCGMFAACAASRFLSREERALLGKE